jgi:hypothetical protein
MWNRVPMVARKQMHAKLILAEALDGQKYTSIAAEHKVSSRARRS